MIIQRITALVNNSTVAELGFVEENGMPSIRKVFCTWHKGLGAHLISTNTSSLHVQKLLKNDKACLYFSDEEKVVGVCFAGKAIVHFDRYYKELMWNDGDEIYYPGGIDDEDYCVIEFVAESGRYYTSDGKGDILAEELKEHDKNKVFEDFSNELV